MGLPADISRWLAPGDERYAAREWRELNLQVVESADSPAFETAYAILEAEFGDRHELETRVVLRSRLAGVRLAKSGTHRLYYRMCLVSGTGGEFAAVRDHTIIVPTDPEDRGVVVHLSHLLVAPAWRRTGLAAWLRAIPAWDATMIQPLEDQFIDLVAEMEPPDPGCAASSIRLAAYGKAGFLTPLLGKDVTYLQPDFRSFEVIDASGGPEPLALILLVRRIGREAERTMPGQELQRLVRALYAMYGTEFRSEDMGPCFEALELLPSGASTVSLTRPE